MDDEETHHTVLEMVNSIKSIDQEEIRGFCFASQLDLNAAGYIMSPNVKPLILEEEAYNILHQVISHAHPNQILHLPREPHAVEEITLCGVQFTTARSSKFQNSRILFQPLGTPINNLLLQEAGIIEDIFEYAFHFSSEVKKTIYILVRSHVRCNPLSDPYPKFGFAGGFICKAETNQLHILEPSQVVSHFGLTKMVGKYEGHVHVMPVDRVCCTLLIPFLHPN